MSTSVPLSLGDVARRYGIQTWQVRRLFERGLLPEPSRVASFRVILADQLPAVEAALRAAGYLRETEVASA
jgi:hypothetical protein